MESDNITKVILDTKVIYKKNNTSKIITGKRFFLRLWGRKIYLEPGELL